MMKRNIEKYNYHFDKSVNSVNSVNLDYNLKDINYNTIYIWTLYLMLKVRPHLLFMCNLSKLNGYHWSRLLIDEPRLSEFCDWDKLNGDDWCQLLSMQPKFVEHCDWYKLNDKECESVLEYQPQLEKYRK